MSQPMADAICLKPKTHLCLLNLNTAIHGLVSILASSLKRRPTVDPVLIAYRHCPEKSDPFDPIQNPVTIAPGARKTFPDLNNV